MSSSEGATGGINPRLSRAAITAARASAFPALHGFPGQVAAGAATVLVHGVGMSLDRQR